MKLEIKNLHASYKNLEILNGINIEIENKAFVGIIGPNGSGKSTLLKCIYRIKDYSGDVFLNDINIKEIPRKNYAKEVSVVEQISDFYFDMVVEDIVLLGRTPYKKFMEGYTSEDYQLVDLALEKVDLLNYKKRKISELSGGEKQRVILARALAQNTNMIILDEPTNHLDIKYQINTIETIVKMEKNVIAALHDINFALKYCDYIFALKNGNIIDQGGIEIINNELLKELYDVDGKIFYNEEDKRHFIIF